MLTLIIELYIYIYILYEFIIIAGKGTYPVWNEKFKLKAEFPSENDDYKIVLKVYDEDRLTEDDFIGTTS